MTISTYYVDSVISAYNKQNRVKIRQAPSQPDVKNDRYADVVSLSKKGFDQAEAYNKISYSLIDVILKDQGR